MQQLRIGWIAPVPETANLDDIRQWAEEQIGEERPGSIAQELAEGYLDYFDGEWQFTKNNNFETVFWTWKKEHCMLYTLRWL